MNLVNIKFWIVVFSLEQFILTVNAAYGGFIPKFRAKLKRKALVSNEILKDPIETKYMDQLVDNFDPLNNATWKMKYFCNWNLYTKNGPFFVYLTGEEAIYPSAIQDGSYMELCKKVGCFICAPEHRFFGDSFPINDTKIESLQFLNMFQALADYARFIKNIKKESDFREQKVLVVGGSYSAIQASLLRAKYPFLVDMVWSSSGVFDEVFNFPGYFEHLGAVIKTVSQICYDEVKGAFHELEKLFWNCHCAVTSKNCDLAERNYQPPSYQTTCVAKIKKFMSDKFQLCDPFDVTNGGDIRNFFQYVAQSFVGQVQYNSNWVAEGLENYTIENLCKNIFEDPNSNKTKIEKLSDFNGMANFAYDYPCTDYTEKRFCDQMRETGSKVNITAGNFFMSRQWLWIVCSQISFLQTTDSLNQPFSRSIPASFLVEQCQCVFGTSFTAEFIETQVKKQILFFGGIAGTKYSSRVIYVSGSYDPWSTAGILYQNETSCANKVIYLQGTSHCFDMHPTFPSDPSQVTEARNKIHGQFIEWLTVKQPCCS